MVYERRLKYWKCKPYPQYTHNEILKGLLPPEVPPKLKSAALSADLVGWACDRMKVEMRFKASA